MVQKDTLVREDRSNPLHPAEVGFPVGLTQWAGGDNGKETKPHSYLRCVAFVSPVRLREEAAWPSHSEMDADRAHPTGLHVREVQPASIALSAPALPP